MQARNNKTIEDAFRRLATNEAFAITDGMKGLMDAAVVHALAVHEERSLYNHLESGDSYGWAVGRQGQCIAMKVTQWYDLPSTDAKITGKLKEMAERLSTSSNKYIGIVMAGMQPEEWYNIEFEEEILYDTMHMIESDFDRYFQKI